MGEYRLTDWGLGGVSLGDWHKWFSSTRCDYSFASEAPATAQMAIEQQDGNIRLATLQGFYPAHIPCAGKHLHLTGDVALIKSQKFSEAIANVWGRCALVVHVVLSMPRLDDCSKVSYSDTFLEFDYHWLMSGEPASCGNWRWVKINDIEPMSGWLAIDVDFTEEFIRLFGQAAYDSASIDYISETVELANASIAVQFRPPWLYDDEEVPLPPPCPDGYVWNASTGVCVPIRKASFFARSVGPFGVPASVLKLMWRARERFVRPEVHRKLHPLV